MGVIWICRAASCGGRRFFSGSVLGFARGESIEYDVRMAIASIALNSLQMTWRCYLAMQEMKAYNEEKRLDCAARSRIPLF